MPALRTGAVAACLLGLAGAAPPGQPAAHPPRPEAVVWLTPLALADSLRARPRPVVVVIGTRWCGYCRLQEATTFRNSAVVAQLRGGFYCVRLDAESQLPIEWAGQRYAFVPTGPGVGRHALAQALGTDGAQPLVYPTTVLLDATLTVRGRWPGLLRAPELLPALAALATP